ncbi:MAG: ATP-grasp domain-containing protein [bacterium]
MKIAVVYNRESKRVINLFGIPNRERYGMRSIKRITDALKKGAHIVRTFEGDKDLIHNLEDFMPRVIKGERPGMVLNLSYGVQGQARYTHVPSILEMVGIPYVGSGPLAHSLALDKVVAKMLFQQHNLPTPEFTVLDGPDFEMPNLSFPLITKPKHEAVSFGLRIVNDEKELREAAEEIFQNYQQSVLVERYIEGREVNVGLMGNNPPEVFAPVEILFGDSGPKIYTSEDKRHKSGREIAFSCPAEIGNELSVRAQDLARRAFKVLGCLDCARMDMRLDNEGNLYLLEVNSLPSLGEHGSYTMGAEHAGLDFTGLVNRLVEVASARYFGTPSPPSLGRNRRSPENTIFSYLTQRRDRLENRVRRWIHLSSRTDDPVGLRNAANVVNEIFSDLGMSRVDSLSHEPSVCTWETKAGVAGGTLLVGHLDVPLARDVPFQSFRREPELLHGEGIGLCRGPLAMLEYVLRALHSARLLARKHIGVLLYTDEGHDCRYSAELIHKAAKCAGRVLVLRPSILDDCLIIERRGQRKYRFVVEGGFRRVDKNVRKPGPFRWGSAKLTAFAELSSSEKRLSVAAVDVHTTSFPMMLPHRVIADILMTYAKSKSANETEAIMRDLLAGNEFTWELDLVSDRPPLIRRRINLKLANELTKIAEHWDIPLVQQSSALPSVAGLVPASIPVLCGVGPVAHDLYTPKESISRISLLQRTLLLAQYLAEKE